MRFLFVDQITESIPGKLIRGVKHVSRDDFYLRQDESGKPCFIASLIGETLGQLAAWNVMEFRGFSQRPVAGIVKSATMHREAYVGDTLFLESKIESIDETAVQYNSSAMIRDEIVFSIEGALGPLLPMENFISPDIVKKQYTQIYRPVNGNPIVEPLSSDPENLALNNLHLYSMNYDSIDEIKKGVSLQAEKKISFAAPYFADHFPNNPVLPLTVLLECNVNLAREFIKRSSFEKSYIPNKLQKIKMNEFVHPGDVVKTILSVKNHSPESLILSFRSEVLGKRVCVLEMVLTSRGS